MADIASVDSVELDTNMRSEMESLFRWEMNPQQTRRCDVVAFMGQNSVESKRVPSAQVYSG